MLRSLVGSEMCIRDSSCTPSTSGAQASAGAVRSLRTLDLRRCQRINRQNWGSVIVLIWLGLWGTAPSTTSYHTNHQGHPVRCRADLPLDPSRQFARVCHLEGL
eukprot:TRINITY_DN22289_c0_g1_i3.p1 TRINITY_DN22289_c0_g1~~TRINITY_DN22289_c0_g1_i3.p1  ORF type:complete len:104 (-),score=20.19 TRINITY_DN22289_c0_g1_i3:541-852(-)